MILKFASKQYIKMGEIQVNIKYSVLMSIYYKEKAEYLEECLNSLINQTIPANEWIIVKDGPLTEELESVLNKFDNQYPNLIKYVILKENKGLGLALRAGVIACSNELIARMDTDDICVPTRMKEQLYEFEKDSKLDICGSDIKEFEGNIENVISLRNVPTNNEAIRKYQKRRSAFNHMTVMYKKSAVLSAGNYEHLPLMEDDMLWIRMLLINCKAQNIDKYLVYARTGEDMIKRRGGFSYLKKYINARKKIYKTGYISFWDYCLTLAIQSIVALVPSKLRIVIFKKGLRE